MQIATDELSFNCFTSWLAAAQAAHPDAAGDLGFSGGQDVQLVVGDADDADTVAGWSADDGCGWVAVSLENTVRMKAVELVYFIATRVDTGNTTQMAASGHMLMHKVQAVAASVVGGGRVRLKLLEGQPAGMVLVLDDSTVEAA